MRNDFDLIDIKITDPLRDRGVVYVGQYGTSGYAIAAKGYICGFIMRGVPISWSPLKFDDSELTDDNYYNILAKTSLDRHLPNVASIILHCTADLWPKYKAENIDKFSNRNVIGYTVWETNLLPTDWPKYINESVNEVWCPSQYNLNTFLNSGVTIPIRVVPHVFLRNELPKKEQISIQFCAGETITDDPNIFTFYNISEMNERKNVAALVEAYCKAFTQKDPVRLILKVHYKNYSAENLTYCVGKINNILRQFPDHAPVMLLARNLSELELLALHSVGDCYVSMTRSEAFGLTIFDAFHYGKKVIVPGCGGQVDYLGANYEGLVEYTLETVKHMEQFTHGYYMQGDQKWANPSIDHAVSLMRVAARKE
jgi:glycosyltransferase involved in cell wall biosynthesis